MEYLDKCLINNVKCLKKEEWYLLKAIRATNQAIGRVIRHSQDWGAIILFEQRFSRKNNRENISKWVNDYLNEYNYFNEGFEALKGFFDKKKQENYIVENQFNNFSIDNIKREYERENVEENWENDRKNKVFSYFIDKNKKEKIKYVFEDDKRKNVSFEENNYANKKIKINDFEIKNNYQSLLNKSNLMKDNNNNSENLINNKIFIEYVENQIKLQNRKYFV